VSAQLRDIGIEPIGRLPWGAHFCEFYRTRQDLIDTLVPYFATGLRNNELCIWVTSEALERDTAEELLAQAVPDYAARRDAGQIELHDYRDWYLRAGSTLDGVLGQWVRKEHEARDRGFDGLRLTGDTLFVHGSAWDEFMSYERAVNEAFVRFRIVGLCTYDVDRCSAGDALDVVRNHQFALARRQGAWEIIEQASLRIAQHELLELARELESRVEERTADLRRALGERDEFLAMLGHELRNPLAPIRSAAKLVRQHSGEHATLGRAAEILERQSAHMSRLVDDLLDVARITRGRIALDRRPTDLLTVLSHAVETVRPLANSRGHRLDLRVPDFPLRVSGDATRLTQIFANLLDNAVKYTPAVGRVDVEASALDAGTCEVVVRDDGMGIEPDALARIFEPFAQGGRPMDRSQGGLGLGLAVVHRLVALHDGTVTASSGGPGRGSEFRVRLPRLQDSVADAPGVAGAGAAVSPASAAAPAAPPRCRVLVVDDNADAVESLAMLVRLWDHEVRTAPDGETALALATTFMPDVVILDLGLPRTDGYEVARLLRARPDFQRVRLVAATGYGQAQDRERTRAAGFDLHLVKPLDPDRLERLLAEAAAELVAFPSGR